MSDPSVSVVVPFYEAERYLAEAVDSVLAQTAPPSEVVLVDDGSTDGGAAVAAAYGPPVRVVSMSHAGSGAARNAGTAACSGELLAFLDADDVWLAHKLERQLELLAADTAVEAVFCGVEEFLSPELPPSTLGGRRLRTASSGPCPSSMVVRRRRALDVGPFTTGLSVTEWLDWYGRLTESGARLAWVDDVLVRRRIHDRNHSRLHRRDLAEYPALLKARLDRGRRR